MPLFKVLERTDDLQKIEDGVKNKWKWIWCEERDGNGDFYSEYLRKIDKPGKAYCNWCQKPVAYGGKGKASMKQHSEKDSHKKNVISTNQVTQLNYVACLFLVEGGCKSKLFSSCTISSIKRLIFELF